MTEEQIIKALECCAYADGCEDCPYSKQCDGVEHITNALDLINRQKAEIERLKAEADMADGYAEAVEERAKAEAIKEFVECLKATIDVDLSCGADSVHYLKDDLSNIMDDLAKEMVGEG